MLAPSRRLGPLPLPKVMFRLQSLDLEESADHIELRSLPVAESTSGDDVQPAIDHLPRLVPDIDRTQRSPCVSHGHTVMDAAAKQYRWATGRFAGEQSA
ncbi:hypothetical protein [Natrinema sp. J7-1]|uniref:hypothetical protein n=1 Tax=Natrinema sp. J7-1 TaxID=1172566 RepID=UPI0006778A16|nr:hypothetical protein [Natrinema sp. J7-1]